MINHTLPWCLNLVLACFSLAGSVLCSDHQYYQLLVPLIACVCFLKMCTCCFCMSWKCSPHMLWTPELGGTCMWKQGSIITVCKDVVKHILFETFHSTIVRMITEIKNALNYNVFFVFFGITVLTHNATFGQQVERVDSVWKQSVKHCETLRHPDKVPLICISSRLVNVRQPLASTLFTEACPSQLSKAWHSLCRRRRLPCLKNSHNAFPHSD